MKWRILRNFSVLALVFALLLNLTPSVRGAASDYDALLLSTRCRSEKAHTSNFYFGVGFRGCVVDDIYFESHPFYEGDGAFSSKIITDLRQLVKKFYQDNGFSLVDNSIDVTIEELKFDFFLYIGPAPASDQHIIEDFYIEGLTVRYAPGPTADFERLTPHTFSQLPITASETTSTLLRIGFGGGVPDDDPIRQVDIPNGWALPQVQPLPPPTPKPPPTPSPIPTSTPTPPIPDLPPGPVKITWDFGDGSEPITQYVQMGSVILAPPTPPAREGYRFVNWQGGNQPRPGELSTTDWLRDYADEDTTYTALWVSEYGITVDMTQETVTLNQSFAGRIYYRLTKLDALDPDSGYTDIISKNKKRAWTAVKDKNKLSRSTFTIDKLIHNSKPVLIEICVSSSKPDKKAAPNYYFFVHPRPKTPKIKLDKSDGYAKSEGYVKLDADTETAYCARIVKSGKPYESLTPIENALYLPVADAKQRYEVKIAPANPTAGGRSPTDAFIPGSKPKKVSVTTNAKPPSIKKSSEALLLKPYKYQISTDGETWYTVSPDAETEDTIEYDPAIKGVSLNNPKIKGHPVYVRAAPTPNKPPSQAAKV